MTAVGFDEKERERFRKIVGVMESATIDGERAAAQEAAERMAKLNGMSLEDAILEAHPERDVGRINADERQARRDDFDAWAASRAQASQVHEASERYRFEQAKREAEERGLDKEAPRKGPAKAKYSPTYRSARYKSNNDDKSRLIKGLLRDGATIGRVAELAGVSTNEVARIWLLMRSNA